MDKLQIELAIEEINKIARANNLKVVVFSPLSKMNIDGVPYTEIEGYATIQKFLRTENTHLMKLSLICMSVRTIKQFGD